MRITYLLMCFLAMTTLAAIAQENHGAGGAPTLTQNNFREPPNSVRPMYRWWVPLSATEDGELRRELKEIAKAGGGGVEVDPMPVPGPLGHSVTFLAEYGFGTPLWSQHLKTIFRTAKDLGISTDLMVSAQYPATVPTISKLNDPVAQQQLVVGYEQVQPGMTRKGILPPLAQPLPKVVTHLCFAARPGDRNLYVDATSGYMTGDEVILGDEETVEHATVLSATEPGASICGAHPSSPVGTITVDTPLLRAHGVSSPVVDIAKTTLVAVLAAQCATSDCAPETGVRSLDRASVTDITGLVNAHGQLEWRAPDGVKPWWVFAFFQTADGQVLANLSKTTPNYVIDHLSPGGAEALAEFYDSSILDSQLRKSLREAGNSTLFEDSFEPSNPLKWTWNFLEEFSRRRGYSLKLLLPCLANADIGARGTKFDFADIGERVREDYRQTWSDLFGDSHLKVYNSWAHREGLRTRNQIEGGPMEVADLSSIPDIPEGENRNFINNPELWKVIGIGAQLRQHESVFSDECCPVDAGIWATTAGGKPFTVAQGTGAPFGRSGDDANLNWVYKAYAGGVNQLVWHGFPYIATPPDSGERSRWPGNSLDGNKGFSEAFGSTMPQWEDYRSINDHLARLQLVLRQGRPQYDIAVFWHDFGEKGIVPNFTPYTGYPGLSTMFSTTSSLAAAGFTYTYVSPHYLSSAAPLNVKHGELFSEQIGFRAIVLNRQEVMPLESLQRIRDLVRTSRFPLVVIGPVPKRVPGASNAEAQDTELRSVVEELRKLSEKTGSNVVFIGDEADLSKTMARLGITPSASHLSNPDSPDILSVHRRTKGTDYYYLFNQGVKPVTQTLSLSGNGTPFELDSWTGRVKPIGLYTASLGRIITPIAIGPNDVKVIAISRSLDGTNSSHIHATNTDAVSVLARPNHLAVRAMRDGSYRTLLSNGRELLTKVKGLPRSIELHSWNLRIESWTPDDTHLAGPEHTRKTLLPDIAIEKVSSDGKLPTWTELGDGDIAGIGYYTTNLVLPEDWTRDTGAFLDLGTVVDTFRVSVNSVLMSAIDYQDPSSIDLGTYLHAGRNTIAIRVATPLRNAVETEINVGAPKLRTYGLIGPITVRPYIDHLYLDHP